MNEATRPLILNRDDAERVVTALTAAITSGAQGSELVALLALRDRALQTLDRVAAAQAVRNAQFRA